MLGRGGCASGNSATAVCVADDGFFGSIDGIISIVLLYDRKMFHVFFLTCSTRFFMVPCPARALDDAPCPQEPYIFVLTCSAGARHLVCPPTASVMYVCSPQRLCSLLLKVPLGGQSRPLPKYAAHSWLWAI